MTDPATLAREHSNFDMFTDAGGRAVARLVIDLRKAGAKHRSGEPLHPDAESGLEALAERFGEVTDTAVREAVAHALAVPEPEPTGGQVATKLRESAEDLLAALDCSEPHADDWINRAIADLRDQLERVDLDAEPSPEPAGLSPADREFAADILRREGNRRINRIEPGDPDDIRDALVAAAQRCDDVAARIASDDRISRALDLLRAGEVDDAIRTLEGG